jgi:hypothetical protein
VEHFIDMQNLNNYSPAVKDVLRAICFITEAESHLTMSSMTDDENVVALAKQVAEDNDQYRGELASELYTMDLTTVEDLMSGVRELQLHEPTAADNLLCNMRNMRM